MFLSRVVSRLVVCLFLIAGITLVVADQCEAKRVYVKGYYRKDGTYVKGHYRTAPDGNPYNNYSTPGNYNPNTGKVTGGNLETYLKKYEKGGWTFPSQRKYTSPTASKILGDATVAPSSKKPFASTSKHSDLNNIQTILAEIRALRRDLEALQQEVKLLSNKPVKAVTGNKIARPAVQGEIEVTIQGDFNGWNGRGSWIHLTNGQIWEQIGSGYKYFKSSTATIYKFSDGYKMWAEGCEKPIRVKRIR